MYTKNVFMIALSILAVGVSVAAQNSSPLLIEFEKQSNYKALLLLVHGWNGSCRTTFGEDEHSLQAVLRNGCAFYDIDCFDYDTSRYASIHDYANELRYRLHEYADHDYEEVIFITHSLGGLVTLQTYTDYFLDQQNNVLDEEVHSRRKPGNLKLCGVYAWASPINGMRDHIYFAIELRNLVKNATDELHQLTGGADAYLPKLKHRIKTVDNMIFNTETFGGRNSFANMPIFFYQGNSSDWVVNPIDCQVGRNEGWIRTNELMGNVIDSNIGHMYIFPETGELGTQSVSVNLAQLFSTCRLSCRPRFNTLFPNNNANLEDKQIERQKKVVETVLAYIDMNYRGDNFAKTIEPVSQFLNLMFQEKVRHSQEVDNLLIAGLKQRLENKEPDRHLVDLYEILFKDVLFAYEPLAPESNTEFGHGNGDTILAVLEFTQNLWFNVKKYLEEQQVSGNHYVDLFTDSQIFFGRFLESQHDAVRFAALETLETNIQSSSDQIICDAGLLKQLEDFYSPRSGFEAIRVHEKVKGIYLHLLQRNAIQIKEDVFTALAKEVAFKEETRPLFACFQDNNLVKDVIQRVSDPEVSIDTMIKFRLLASIIAYGGATGNDSKTTKMAAYCVIKDFPNLSDKDVQEEVAELIEKACEVTPYQYSVARQLTGLLEDWRESTSTEG